LSDDAFHGLLSSLDPDPDCAARKYEDLRHKLVVFFCGRRVLTAEDQADETIDRLSRRIAEGEPIQDLGRFAYGVARLVFKESLKRDHRQRGAFAALAPPQIAMRFDSDAGIECIRRCVGRLETADRELILAYYGSDGREGQRERQDLAGRLEISSTALRLRAYRIRRSLEACARRCLDGPTGRGGWPDGGPR
jgi:DNA-directed RNA polymerase specialized sigma24 family protein